MLDDKEKEWFENWFDSPYYHILYKHRNFNEAELFIDNLVNCLQPKSNARFLDVGCGKGRHSLYLNKKGFTVTGIDLSAENIAYASQFENENLKFYVEDMRKINRVNEFDCVLNMFTSFGYFENECDDYATIKGLSIALKANGIFVLDFMNAQKVLANLVVHEVKIIEDIEFSITKSVENNFIVKRIQFSFQGKEHHFQERVKVLTLADFETYFAANELKIIHLYGNYNLEGFDPIRSSRLILVAKKN
jgi:SAM-dependent methyltransferase